MGTRQSFFATETAIFLLGQGSGSDVQLSNSNRGCERNDVVRRVQGYHPDALDSQAIEDKTFQLVKS